MRIEPNSSKTVTSSNRMWGEECQHVERGTIQVGIHVNHLSMPERMCVEEGGQCVLERPYDKLDTVVVEASCCLI